MALPPHLPYDSAGFFGREDIVKSIIETLADPEADQKRKRALMVEGPAGRGKTWLLREVHRQVESNHQNRVAVCFFAGSEFQPADGQPVIYADTVAYQLIVRLWNVVHTYCPSLPMPMDIAERDSEQERGGKILGLFAKKEPYVLLRELFDNIKEVEYLLLLIVLDGMDEIEKELLRTFEFELITVLFMYPGIRLLSSRRVDSSSYVWRKQIIKQQNHIWTLEPFDSPGDQINHLLKFYGSSITFEKFRKKMSAAYSWSNPGANAFLVDCAMKNKPKNRGRLSADCIRACIKYLTQSLRDPEPIDDQTFEYVRRIAIQFKEIDTQGAARHRINAVLDDKSDKERDEFLGSLQDRGIGYFGNNGNYILHTDFVELFRELETRKR